jgi:hypothetical protein
MQRAESWLNVHGIWRAMRADPRFDPVVWIIANADDPTERIRLRNLCRDVLEQHDIDTAPSDLEADPVLGPRDFDVAIFNAPYDRERPAAFHFDRVAKAIPLTVYVPYGLVMGAGWKNRRFQYAQPTQIGAGLIVARSAFERDLYAKYCPSGAGHVALTGLPRLDELYDLDSFEVDPSLVGEVDGRFAVLWNSHFSFGLGHARDANYSTFDTMSRAFFAFARQRPDIALIWRPHPSLFRALRDEGVFKASDLAAFREEVRTAGVILDERPDHRHAFVASSMLMTDLGSFLVEYLATDKPVVYLENPDGEGLNEEGTALIQYLDVARTPAHALYVADAFAAGVDAKAALRAVAKDRFLPMLDGMASQRVVDAIAVACGRAGAATPDETKVSSLLDAMHDRLDAITLAKQRLTKGRGPLARLAGHARRHAAEWIKRHPTLLRAVERLLGSRR